MSLSALERTLEETLLIIALAVVSFITFFANLLVIAAFCIDKRLRKTNNYFVVSLTIVGFLTGGYSIPLYCITKWTKIEPLPSICQLCGFLDNALATISVWTLAMTSLDRYYMVINYKRYKQIVTPGRAKLVLLLVWVYGGLVCAPPLMGWNEYHFSNTSATCGMKHFVGDVPDKEYFLFYIFTSFPAPLVIVTFSYTRIFIQAWGVYRRRERRVSAALNRTIQQQKMVKKRLQAARGQCEGSSVVNGTSDIANGTSDIANGTSDIANGTSEIGCKSIDHSSTSVENGNHASNHGSNIDNHDSVSGIHGSSTGNNTSNHGNNAGDHGNKSNYRGSYLLSHTTCGNGAANNNTTTYSSPKVKKKFYRRFSKQTSCIGNGGMTIDKTVRASLMVFVLVITNITCTFPIFVFSLVVYWDNNVGSSLPTEMLTFFIFLFFLNSALNPIMYGVFNTNFRGAFQRLLRCEYLKNDRQGNARYKKLTTRLSNVNCTLGAFARDFRSKTSTNTAGIQTRPGGTKPELPTTKPPKIRIHIINSGSGSFSSLSGHSCSSLN